MFLDALKGKNQNRPPVWIMRQAGRYLPAYRSLREKYSLRDLFLTPELAARITKMPVDLLGVDAAILFSDITIVALALGLKLNFSEGPMIEGSIQPTDVGHALKPVIDAIHIAKSELTVPLIGFCGGPFTVATYILGGVANAKKQLYQNPQAFTHLLEQITDATITYLSLCERAGVDAVQIFDSWANELSKEHFDAFCMPYLKKIVSSLHIPTIFFMRSAHMRAPELASLNVSAISFDWQKPLSILRKELGPSLCLQGNLDPDILYAPLPFIEQKTNELLLSMENDPAFIVNLGHGMKPDMPVEAVHCFVNTVQKWHPRYNQ